MFITVLGHYTKNRITFPNGEEIIACPYKNILSDIFDKKGFYLLLPFPNNPDTYVIKNYVLVDDELYMQLTEN
jgi:hypothetical protein